MAERRHNTRRQPSVKASAGGKSTYVYGNTVRKLDVERNPKVDREENRQREYNKQRRSDMEYISSMNIGYVLFLVVSAVIVFGAMGHFLVLSSQVNKNKNAVAKLKESTINLKADNDDYERRLERNLNIEEIKRIAIEELGMVYPTGDQIVNYEYSENDYVRQYSDVPQD